MGGNERRGEFTDLMNKRISLTEFCSICTFHSLCRNCQSPAAADGGGSRGCWEWLGVPASHCQAWGLSGHFWLATEDVGYTSYETVRPFEQNSATCVVLTFRLESSSRVLLDFDATFFQDCNIDFQLKKFANESFNALIEVRFITQVKFIWFSEGLMRGDSDSQEAAVQVGFQDPQQWKHKWQSSASHGRFELLWWT